jgi:carboxypeptidase T
VKKSVFLLLVVFVLSAATTYVYADDFFADRDFLRIYTFDVQDRGAVANIGFAIDYVDLEAGYVEAWVPLADIERIKELGFAYDVVSTKDTFPPSHDAYHDYAEQVAFVTDLAAQYPEITDLFSIGKSLENRDLWCIKISDNPMQDELDEPAIAVVAMHHAREILTPEMALYAAQQLVEGYGNNEEITAYVENREIFIVINLNPDGGEYDHSGGSFHMWRKNRRVNEGSQCRGVDLNRNYGYLWGGVGSSGRACDDTYHGTVAFSEPESSAFRDFVLAHENINMLLTLHTHAKLVLYPWGNTSQHIDDQIDFLTHKQLAEYQGAILNYTANQASSLYPTTGDTTDWSYGARGITSFTWEMAPGQFDLTGFYPPPSMIASETPKGFVALRVLLNYTREPSYILATDPWKFEANVAKGGVQIVWKTLIETNPKGYVVTRSDAGADDYEPLHEGLIDPGQKEYAFLDETVEDGNTYDYLLQYQGTANNDVEFGPLTVTLGGGDDDDDDTAPVDDDDDTAPTDDDDATPGDDDAADDDDDDNDDGGCGC